MGLRKVINKTSLGFSLIEVLVSLAILGFVFSASLKIFSSNAAVTSALQEKIMAQFVAENALVLTFVAKDELIYGFGNEQQGGLEYLWERTVTFAEDSKSAQINISVSNFRAKIR